MEIVCGADIHQDLRTAIWVASTCQKIEVPQIRLFLIACSSWLKVAAVAVSPRPTVMRGSLASREGIRDITSPSFLRTAPLPTSAFTAPWRQNSSWASRPLGLISSGGIPFAEPVAARAAAASAPLCKESSSSFAVSLPTSMMLRM